MCIRDRACPAVENAELANREQLHEDGNTDTRGRREQHTRGGGATAKNCNGQNDAVARVGEEEEMHDPQEVHEEGGANLEEGDELH
eukprot:15014236-Alexandrium_andersonii.AAC.1